MVGAFLFTVVIALGSIAEWSAKNYPMVFATVVILTGATTLCYLVGYSVMRAIPPLKKQF